MTKFFRRLAEMIDDKENVVVATIFDKSGSAPRTAGAKMAVRSDGTIVGTIGGGRLEAEAVRLAGEVFSSRQSIVQSFDLSGEDVSGMDMICGGRGEFLLDFVDAGDPDNRAVYAEVAGVLRRREKAWLITSLGEAGDSAPESRQQCLVKPDGAIVGRFSGDQRFVARLAGGPARISIHAEVLDGRRLLVEPIRCGGTVYIFGAGHVSQKIAPLSDMVGFRTVVLDDRPEYASRERFPGAAEIIAAASFEQIPPLSVDTDSYIVIVTRGHLHDKTVLEWALRTEAGYIGMIGSRRKRDTIYAALAGQGFGPTDLARVYSPIGTDIGAETPEELAVSIVGELIKVRAERESARRTTGAGS